MPTQAKKKTKQKTTKRCRCPSGKQCSATPEEVLQISHLLNLTSTFFKRWFPEDVQACRSEETFWNGYAFCRNCRILLAFSLGLFTFRTGIRRVDRYFAAAAQRSVVLAPSFLPSYPFARLCSKWAIPCLRAASGFPVCVSWWRDVWRRGHGSRNGFEEVDFARRVPHRIWCLVMGTFAPQTPPGGWHTATICSDLRGSWR